MDVLEWTKQNVEEEKEIGIWQVEIWEGSLNAYGMGRGSRNKSSARLQSWDDWTEVSTWNQEEKKF